MPRGGYQPGGGRPKGAKNKKTQELIKRATEEGVSPIDVLLSDMRFFYNLGEEQMLKAKEASTSKEQSKAFRAAAALKETARNCASAAAPYIHPKLSSVDANVSISNMETALAELE